MIRMPFKNLFKKYRRFFRGCAIFLAFLAIVSLLFVIAIKYQHHSDKLRNAIVEAPKKPPTDDLPYYDSIGDDLIPPHDSSEGDSENSALNSAQNRYTLEFDVTTTREDAQALVDHLGVLGVEAYFTPLLQGTKVIYRVRRGIYPTEQIALDDSAALKKEKKLVTKVVLLQ